jgi:hypothetical protein
MTDLLPKELVGHFFGVGSLGESTPSVPVEYVKKLELPYAYSITALPEEDMIRQFAFLVDGYEKKGDFILDVDIHTYRDIISDDEPLMLDKQHGHSYYLMRDGTHYPFFKTQQTAPASMCFSIRDSNGKQHVTRNMFHFFQRLMTRIAHGQVEYLREFCDTIILCQDDPGLGHVTAMISQGKVPGLNLREIFRKTDSIYPDSAIPAFHYCDDWRQLNSDGWYPLWESSPKLIHIDVVRYPPQVSEEQALIISEFLREGGGLALGVLPNVDDSYAKPVLETLQDNLTQSLHLFYDSGVDPSLVKRNTMISTQCGLSGASPELSKRIHDESFNFKDIFYQVVEAIE